jgi:hypothetical protein
MERNNRDEIIDEVRAARQAYAARFGFDIRRIVEDLKAKESKHPERRADLRPVPSSITGLGKPSSLRPQGD